MASVVSTTTTGLSPKPSMSPMPSSPGPDEESGWACGRDGRCALLPGIDLKKVEVVRLDAEHRLFRLEQPQPGKTPNHILTWGETRGAGLIVWSSFASKCVRAARRRRSSTSSSSSSGSDRARTLRSRNIRVVVPTAANIDPMPRRRIERCLDNAVRVCPAKLRRLGYTRVVKARDELAEMEWHVVYEAAQPATAEQHVEA